jgi:hypothetical protein
MHGGNDFSRPRWDLVLNKKNMLASAYLQQKRSAFMPHLVIPYEGNEYVSAY